MHGGVKIYTGAPAAARHYVQMSAGRADDYYLAEGVGVARRFTATPDLAAGTVAVTELSPLQGEGYAAWVAGVDPDTGVPRGRVRQDRRAVRFVEVTVNGPKSWSLAAELHPDIAAAYDAAQDRAASQVIGWLAQHATTRVGPRGGQVSVPVEVVEAVTVRHYTSRAGDPHRHLHLQLNARVFAAGRWRGVDTVAVRDSIGAVNGIGHAAVMTDPAFRAALAAHGYTLDPDGEITQLAPHVGAFSRRAAQIATNLDRYETDWTAAHPGEQPGPELRRVWDARAWAEQRPDKITPQPGDQLNSRWLRELEALGYRDRDIPTLLAPTPVGRLDRDAAVAVILSRLGAARSAWNAADIRGEVEHHLARSGIVVDAGVRGELAEDLTARTLGECLTLLDSDDVPDHVRVLTSVDVVRVERELRDRLTTRASGHGHALSLEVASRLNLHVGDGLDVPVERVRSAAQHAGRLLDSDQARAVAALAGQRRLVVVEGAAGAGKTTTLAATRDLLTGQGRGLVVVTPTLRAAQSAAAELGAPAGSVAALVFQHGWRWDENGVWTRLAVGDLDPVTGRVYRGPHPAAPPDPAMSGAGVSGAGVSGRASSSAGTLGPRASAASGTTVSGRRVSGALLGAPVLRAGDLVVCDEAGMLDQDTALALLTVADECQVRVAFLGDRHQLAAVGRGGVLDLAHQAAGAGRCHDLTVVHRFLRHTQFTGNRIDLSAPAPAVPDRLYAKLTAAMRTGSDPGLVFAHLYIRGQVTLHADVAAQYAAVADQAAAAYTAGVPVAVVVDTREQVSVMNAAIRGRLVTAGRVDDGRVVSTRAGDRIGVGDRVATRRNDRGLGVANRDTWTVTQVHADGGLTVIRAGTETVRVLPGGYVQAHVELGYASTAHGVQGDTVDRSLLVMGEHTGAAGAYVAMTRGRYTNTTHLVAATITDAERAWEAAFARNHADLGPAHAAQHAAQQGAGNAAQQTTPPATPTLPAVPIVQPELPKPPVRSLAEIDRDLDPAFKELIGAEHEVSRLEWELWKARPVAARVAADQTQLAESATRCQDTARAQQDAAAQAAATHQTVAVDTEQILEKVRAAWDTQRAAAATDATLLPHRRGRR